MQCTSRSQYNHKIFLFGRKNRMEQRGEKVPIVRRCTCKNNNYSDREYRHKYNQSARRIYRKELLSSACIARCFLQQKWTSLSPLHYKLHSNTYCCCYWRQLTVWINRCYHIWWRWTWSRSTITAISNPSLSHGHAMWKQTTNLCNI